MGAGLRFIQSSSLMCFVNRESSPSGASSGSGPPDTSNAIAAVGGELSREFLSEVGRTDWTLVRLDVCTFAQTDAGLDSQSSTSSPAE